VVRNAEVVLLIWFLGLASPIPDLLTQVRELAMAIGR
jgi:hypothetical protein